MRKLLVLLQVVALCTMPTLAQQTLKPGTYRVKPPPTREQLCAAEMQQVRACEEKAAVCASEASECSAALDQCKANVAAAQEALLNTDCPPCADWSSVCLQPVDGWAEFGLPAPDSMDAVAFASARPWYRDWRFWVSAVGVGIVGYYGKRYIDKMGDGGDEHHSKTVVICGHHNYCGED